MTATAEIIDRCQNIFDDLHFGAAREWKAAAPGRFVVGFMPFYVPRELIHAAGGLPLGVLGGGDQLEVIHGDAYYQSYICRIPRSTLELAVTGRLDFVDAMLFPSICDVIRNLSGMWKILFPKVRARYFDVPQNFSDQIGGTFYIHELTELRALLAELAGRAGDRRGDPRVHRAVQRKSPAGARGVCVPRPHAVEGAGGGGVSAHARRHGAGGGRAQPDAGRVPCRPRRPRSGRCATTRAWWSPARSANSRR